jgi:hypothetical protein
MGKLDEIGLHKLNNNQVQQAESRIIIAAIGVVVLAYIAGYFIGITLF